MKACPCACCANWSGQVTAGREPADWCWCDLYPEPEQCDCGPCAELIR